MGLGANLTHHPSSSGASTPRSAPIPPWSNTARRCRPQPRCVPSPARCAATTPTALCSRRACAMRTRRKPLPNPPDAPTNDEEHVHATENPENRPHPGGGGRLADRGGGHLLL